MDAAIGICSLSFFANLPLFSHISEAENPYSFIPSTTIPSLISIYILSYLTVHSNGYFFLTSLAEERLIPFGHNDKYVSGAVYDETIRAVPGVGNEWDIELMEYINFARSIDVTPILITASSSMAVHKTLEYYRHRTPHLDDSTPVPYEHLRGEPADWPQTVIDMGVREDILVLDLMSKSVDHYKTFPDDQAVYDAYWGTNDVHTNEAGARMLANYIKVLAEEAGATGFIEQFQ